MISAEFCTLATLFLYAIASFSGLYGMMARSPRARNVSCWLAFFAFFSQTMLLLSGFHKFFPNGLSAGAYLQLFSWFIQISGLLTWFVFRQQSLCLFATQFGLIIFIFSVPYIHYPIHLPGLIETSFYILHIGALFLFFGILTIGFFSAILFIVISRRIKYKKKIAGIWQDFPALDFLDKINGYCTLILFPLFSGGIIFGFSRVFHFRGQLSAFDSRVILSLVMWLFLAVLFHSRIANGWKGRKPAIMLVIIFIICIFSIFVVTSYFVSMHNFIDS